MSYRHEAPPAFPPDADILISINARTRDDLSGSSTHRLDGRCPPRLS